MWDEWGERERREREVSRKRKEGEWRVSMERVGSKWRERGECVK